MVITGTRLMDIFFLIILRVFPIYCLFFLFTVNVQYTIHIHIPKYSILHIDCKHEILGASDNDLIKTDSK
jgi:hypothetical protein